MALLNYYPFIVKLSPYYFHVIAELWYKMLLQVVFWHSLWDLQTLCAVCWLQALALIELFNAPEGRYKQDVYLLPKKMGKKKQSQFRNLLCFEYRFSIRMNMELHFKHVVATSLEGLHHFYCSWLPPCELT